MSFGTNKYTKVAYPQKKRYTEELILRMRNPRPISSNSTKNAELRDRLNVKIFQNVDQKSADLLKNFNKKALGLVIRGNP